MSNNLIKQTNEERVLFKIFLEVATDFAHEVADWHLTGRGQDPPDVICTTVSGKRVGVEICQWACECDMKAGRLRDKIDGKILAAIGPQPVNTSEHFWLVVFHPKSKMLLLAGQSGAFRKALLDLISYVDREWSRVKHHGSAYHFRALEQFNPLHKYLDTVSFCPRSPGLDAAVSKAITELGGNTEILQAVEEQTDWIVPIGRAQPVRTPYDKEQWEPDENGNVTIEGSLLKLLKHKAGKCCETNLKTPCSEVHLLIAIHDAIPYSPMTTTLRGTATNAVERARSCSAWPFRRVYLLMGEETPTASRLL